MVIAMATAAAGLYASRNHVRSATLIVLSAHPQGWAGTAAAWRARAFSEEALTLPSRHGPLRARLYRPEGDVDRSLVLVPGVHALGIEEPRLVSFARSLAAVGVGVVTPEPPDLKEYRITARSTDMIEDAVVWLAGRPDLAPDGHAGLIGISFAGGLSIVAAGRPALRDRAAFVLAFGGHGDLPRVLWFLCTGVLPDGTRRPPHDYGVVVILLNTVDRIVPPEQVDGLRAALLTFLEASHLDMFDKEKAREAFEHAREMEAALPEPAATFMRYVNTRNVAELGPRLLPHIAEFGGDPALSPERSSPPRATVYLLHGSDDNVIPAMESLLLADHLQSTTLVRCLVSPLITHAEINRSASLMDVWRLIGFWAGVLAE